MSRKISIASTRENDTTKHTLYTVPTKNTGLWSMLYVISLTGNAYPTVYWYDSSTDTEYQILGAKNLGAGNYVLFSDAEVVLQEGDQIRIQNTTVYKVTYIATVELVPNQATQFHGA